MIWFIMKKILNRKGLWACFALSLVAVFVSSCSNDDDYSPISASAQFRGILVSCHDKDGKNLLSDKAFAKGISAYGYESNKKLSCKLWGSAGQFLHLL